MWGQQGFKAWFSSPAILQSLLVSRLSPRAWLEICSLSHCSTRRGCLWAGGDCHRKPFCIGLKSEAPAALGARRGSIHRVGAVGPDARRVLWQSGTFEWQDLWTAACSANPAHHHLQVLLSYLIPGLSLVSSGPSSSPEPERSSPKPGCSSLGPAAPPEQRRDPCNRHMCHAGNAVKKGGRRGR